MYELIDVGIVVYGVKLVGVFIGVGVGGFRCLYVDVYGGVFCFVGDLVCKVCCIFVMLVCFIVY